MLSARSFIVPIVCCCVVATELTVYSQSNSVQPPPFKIKGSTSGAALTVNNLYQSNSGVGVIVKSYGVGSSTTSTNNDAIDGFSEAQGYNAVNGTGTNGATGVLGMSDTGPSGVFLGGTGVFAESASGYAAYSASSSNGGTGFGATMTGGGTGVYATTDTGTAGSFSASGQNGLGIYASSSDDSAIYAIASPDSISAINGTTTGSGSAGIYGSAYDGAGVYGYATSGAGGYFTSQNGTGISAASSASNYDAVYATSSGSNAAALDGISTNGPGLIVSSNGSTAVSVTDDSSSYNPLMQLDKNGNLYLRGTLYKDAYASSTAASMAGESRLVGGTSVVRLSASAKRELAGSNYLVTVTPEGDSRGVYVTARTSDGFTVRENMQGRDTVAFTYRLDPTQNIAGPRAHRNAVPRIAHLKPMRRANVATFRLPRFALHLTR